MKIVDDPSIIESTFIKVSALTMHNRIVLREIKADDGFNCKPEWVTHCENLEFNDGALVHHSFYDGHYFRNKEEAVANFLSRSKEQGFG